jgi:hypothetical protein
MQRVGEVFVDGADFCFLVLGRCETVGMKENKSRFGSRYMWVGVGGFWGFGRA